MKDKKISQFDISDLLPIGLTLVVTGIGIAYGLNVMGDMRDDFVRDSPLTFTCNSSLNGGTGSRIDGCGGAEINSTNDAITGVGKLPSKMPLIATVVVAALIIGILVRYLMVKYN